MVSLITSRLVAEILARDASTHLNMERNLASLWPQTESVVLH